MSEFHTKNPVVLFDGVCNLCNGFVNFMIRVDRNAIFKFLPIQSPLAEKLITTTDLPAEVLNDLNTVVLIIGNKGYLKSQAVIEIAHKLNYPWRALAIGRFLPQTFLDWMYDFVANNRYRWFGKRNSCMVPTQEILHRFISK